jgi:hypothetical protein
MKHLYWSAYKFDAFSQKVYSEVILHVIPRHFEYSYALTWQLSNNETIWKHISIGITLLLAVQSLHVLKWKSPQTEHPVQKFNRSIESFRRRIYNKTSCSW